MVKTGKKAVVKATRQRRLTRKQNKQVAKKKADMLAVPTSFNILGQVFTLLRHHWKILGGITLIYIVLNITLASGLSNTVSNFSSVKDSLGPGHNFSDALRGFVSLLSGGTRASSQSASVLQSVLIVLESLVVIWTLRQLLAGKKISIKDAYYKSMMPLVPFLLVVFVIIIQLLPITLGASLIALIASALASSTVATPVMILVLIPLFGWSVYMFSSSIFALYIVTLPDMQPRQALLSAKKLVNFRRLKIIRRIVFLPIFILVVTALIMLPLILFVRPLVVPVFYLLSTLITLLVHSYLYTLYRGLLNGR